MDQDEENDDQDENMDQDEKSDDQQSEDSQDDENDQNDEEDGEENSDEDSNSNSSKNKTSSKYKLSVFPQFEQKDHITHPLLSNQITAYIGKQPKSLKDTTAFYKNPRYFVNDRTQIRLRYIVRADKYNYGILDQGESDQENKENSEEEDY